MTYVDRVAFPLPLVNEPADEEPALIARARGGDTHAFERLYRTHVRRVYAVCLRMAADVTRAEDFTQRTFVTAWQKLALFRADSAFGTWLHRIAVNVTHDAATRRKASPAPFSALLANEEEDGDDIANLTPDSSSGPSDAVTREERRQAVRRALAELPPHHRTVLVLFDIEGHTYEELAATLELPMGTVKSRLNRARLALREKLESCRELFEE